MLYFTCNSDFIILNDMRLGIRKVKIEFIKNIQTFNNQLCIMG